VFADVPRWLTETGVVLVTVAGIVTAIGILTRLAPVRWLWRTVVSDPLARWGRAWVREEVDAALVPVKAELSYNGGHTVKDITHANHEAVKRLEDLRHLDAENRFERQQNLDSRLGSIDERLATGDERMGRIEGLLGRICPDLDDTEGET
jgi:hypothetical protein